MSDFHTSLLDAIDVRITTRFYEDRPIDEDLSRQLRQNIDAINAISGLHIQLIEGHPEVFAEANTSGHLRNARNFIALVGPKDQSDALEMLGYYGERLALSATLSGLQTGWVAGSWDKAAAEAACAINPDEALYLCLTIGYQEDYDQLMNKSYEERCAEQQSHRPSKKLEELYSVVDDAQTPLPDWFLDGIKSVQKAPSAMNRQPIHFTFNSGNDLVRAFSQSSLEGPGIFSLVDLGIAKLHFQIGAGGGRWEWGDDASYARR